MKRKKRNPEKFDPVELFTAIGRDRGYTITPDSDVDDFVERVGRSLKSSQTNPALLHGCAEFRAEGHGQGEGCSVAGGDGDLGLLAWGRWLLEDGV